MGCEKSFWFDSMVKALRASRLLTSWDQPFIILLTFTTVNR